MEQMQKPFPMGPRPHSHREMQLNTELQSRQKAHLKVKAGVLACLVGHWADFTILPQRCSKDEGLDALQQKHQHLSIH